jgi:hypothetical protein
MGTYHVLACNIGAIGEADLPSYKILCTRLQNAITDRRELSDGYALRFDGELFSLMDAAQWVSLERLCCPFLMFQLQTIGSDHDYWLTLQGPSEAKAIVGEAFSPAAHNRDRI